MSSCGLALSARTVEMVKVQSKRLERLTRLSGRIPPNHKVALHARMTDFFEKAAPAAVRRIRPVRGWLFWQRRWWWPAMSWNWPKKR
jgi:hypothetical protein